MPPSRNASPSKSQSPTADPSQPETPQPKSQPKSGEGSSRRSRTRASKDGGFFADTGPGFDPDARTEPPPQPAPVPGLEPVGWQEDSVRSILSAKGALLHGLVGVGEEDWAYTDRDLQAIAPPLTRILNRYPVTAAAGGTGDEIAVVVGLGGYVTRSYVERRAVLASRRPPEPQPVTGRAPEPGDVPPEQPLHAQPSPVPAPEEEEPFPDPPETGLRSAGPDARRFDR